MVTEEFLKASCITSCPRNSINQIALASILFATLGPGSKKTKTVTEIVQKIDLWRRRTQHLRTQVGWWSEKPVKLPNGNVTREWVLKKYFVLTETHKANFDIPLFRLAFLDWALEGAIAASEFAVRELTAPSYPGTRESEMWFIWVALVEHAVRLDRIRTTAGSGSDKRHSVSPFVAFILELQTLLPKKCWRRETPDSVAKGIQTARKNFFGRKLRRDAAILMMFGSGLGGHYFSDRNGLRPRLHKASRNLEQFLAARNQE